MSQLDSVENADQCVAAPLNTFENLPAVRHAPVAEYVHCYAPNADAMPGVRAGICASKVGGRRELGGMLSRMDASLITSLILGVLIAAELMRMLPVTSIRGLDQFAISAPVMSPRARTKGIEVTNIIAAHLFGVATTDPSVQDPASAVPTSTQLVLLGTVATDDPKRGVAIISDGWSANVYRVGEDLGPARLHSIYLDRVVIDRSGTLESVILPRSRIGGAAVAADAGVPQRMPGSAASAPRAARLPQGEFGVFQDLMHTEAATDAASGKMRGIRVAPGSDSSAFESAGLHSGDVIIAVDGVRLDNPQRSEDVLEKIRNGAGATLLVEREGRAQRLGLDFARFGRLTGSETPE